MNQLQILIVGSIILFVGVIVHIIIFNPPTWITILAGFIGLMYYLLRFWFAARIPGDLVIFFFEMLLAIVIAYGLLIGGYTFL